MLSFLPSDVRRSAMRRPLLWALGAVVCATVPAAAQDRRSPVPPSAEDTQPQNQGPRYTLSVTSSLSAEIEERVMSATRLQDRAEEPVASLFVLDQRMANDRQVLIQALNSLGYYEPEIAIERGDPQPPAGEVTVAVTIEPGPRYQISSASRLRLIPADARVEGLEAVTGLFDGATPADASTLGEAIGTLIGSAQQAGYPFADLVEDRYFLQRDTQRLRVALTIDLGPRIRLSGIRVEGTDQVETDVIERQIVWQDGDVYEPATLSAFRRRLIELDVFASVETVLDRPEDLDSLPPDATLPVIVRVSERDHRSIGGEIAFDTDRGLFLGASWTHRNLTGEADRLRIEAETTGLVGGSSAASDLSNTDVRLSSTYLWRDLLRQDQDLVLGFEAAQETTDAFERQGIVLSAAVSRRISETMNGSLGVSVSQAILTPSENEDGEEEEQYVGLLSFPAELAIDTSDDLLNPTAGYRTTTRLVPNVGLGDTALLFATLRNDSSVYYDVFRNDALVLAARGALGVTLGSSTDIDDIPADQRFYAGGGGSVRGYSFQGVGPERGSDPLGGQSVAEASFEARFRIGDIGIVPFVDVGYVSENPFPELDTENIGVGAGLGLRYYSPIGPIRLDVAAPLTQTDGEPTVAAYISIGQAF